MKPITIAIASGKGGTGKTTLAVALALALNKKGESVTLLDADVEAPNAHIFLKAELKEEQIATSSVPEVNEELCDGCGICREVCEFNAIAMIADRPLVFSELCHACGSCTYYCPENAITEVPVTVGWIEQAQPEQAQPKKLDFHRGRLKIGDVHSVTVIETLRKCEGVKDWTIIDCPPGSSCPVIAATRKADYLILVTEPTPFGLNDLKLAVEMSKAINLDCGVVINRSDMGNDDVRDYCRSEDAPILLEIPFDRNLAKTYSEGGSLLKARPEMAKQLISIANDIAKDAKAGRAL